MTVSPKWAVPLSETANVIVSQEVNKMAKGKMIFPKNEFIPNGSKDKEPNLNTKQDEAKRFKKVMVNKDRDACKNNQSVKHRDHSEANHKPMASLS